MQSTLKNFEGLCRFVGDEAKLTAAILTGLEPATSAVTGRRANQLRYRTLVVYLPSPYK